MSTAPTFEITTASPAPSTSSAESIQPMHVAPQDQAQLPHGSGAPEHGHAAMTLGAKGFLAKKMAASGQVVEQSSFQSPTDQMVSPCTKKLAASKQRHFGKGKPLSLFQAQAGAPQQQQKKLSGLAQSSTLGSENQAPF
ncbi:hypothetical protein C6P46_003273 [Rhodotorula mucilaginosa]|uniref:Spo12 family protein n=1 Tax=Rhodotorula mucilaginosa TaxID=5537 RepID=A0A9P7B7H3_RHOMI|nr:hypothetical protein C6P46_003273 [Rhodotorula mucilaginosa]